MWKRTFFWVISITLLCSLFNKVIAQPTWTIDLLGNEKKPENETISATGSGDSPTGKGDEEL